MPSVRVSPCRRRARGVRAREIRSLSRPFNSRVSREHHRALPGCHPSHKELSMNRPSLRIAACLMVATTVGAAFSPARAADPPAATHAPLLVTARLVEIPGSFPPDDLYDYAYVMRYEVIGGPM